MSENPQDLGRAELIGAEAIGEPGKRRFRLFVRAHRGTASLWMEREQMDALASAIDRLLAEGAGALVLRPLVQVNKQPSPSAPSDFPQEPDIDFQIGQLQVGYDGEEDVVLLRAAPLRLLEPGDDPDEFIPQFSTYLSSTQAGHLSTSITDVLSAGRPRCPLCGAPMQPAHICEKQNGFHPIGLN